jgi:hypothetical protein
MERFLIKYFLPLYLEQQNGLLDKRKVPWHLQKSTPMGLDLTNASPSGFNFLSAKNGFCVISVIL